MTPRSRLAVAMFLACSPVLAHAQPRAAGWYLIPSAAVVEEYDSNIFGSREDPTSDFITRLVGELTLGYRSQPLTVLGSYSIAGEVYADNSDLNNIGDRQRARFLVEYRPERRLELRFDAFYGRTNDVKRFGSEPTPPVPVQAPAPAPAPDAPATGPESAPEPGVPSPGVATVEFGRQLVEVVRVTPSVSYEFAPFLSGEAAYTFRYIDEEGEPTSTEHALRLGLARELTPVDTGRITYRFRYFDFGTDSDTSYSNAITFGWERQVTPRLSILLAAGPRVDEDESVDAEARARVSYRLQPATVAFAYSRTQEIAVGLVGPQTIDRFAGSLVGRPLANVVGGANIVAGVTGSVTLVSSEQVNGASQEDTIYQVSAHVSYRLTRRLTARARYDFSLEQDNGPGDIVSHVVSVALEYEEPFRIY
jgi:hypothetical protein